jgi:basic membrane lipoprotein Med (substrate-binding protein (PBP1-ABC) superfamily)
MRTTDTAPTQSFFGRSIIALAFAALAPLMACNNSPSQSGTPASAAPTGAAGTEPKIDDDKRMKVGFVTVGPVSDWGYNYAHNEGRIFLEGAASKDFHTTIVEKVPESGEAERVMEKMIAAGTKVIFPTSYGYLDPALRVAERHPDVVFMHCGGYKTAKNLGTYFAYIHEPMYVAGTVAGRMTKTNKMGFVAAHPIPQVLRNINAFALGARSVNPNVVVRVVWTNNWNDPATEAEAAKSLIDLGADVLSMHQDSPITVVQTAESRGVYSIGYHADLHQFAPKGWLTGAMWDWGSLYLKIAQQVKDGTWKSEAYRAGMESGAVKIASFGPAVPLDIQKQTTDLRDKVVRHEFVVFQGPIKDRDGRERLAAGAKPDFDWLEKMDWFVEGVEGSIPRK